MGALKDYITNIHRRGPIKGVFKTRELREERKLIEDLIYSGNTPANLSDPARKVWNSLIMARKSYEEGRHGDALSHLNDFGYYLGRYSNKLEVSPYYLFKEAYKMVKKIKRKIPRRNRVNRDLAIVLRNSLRSGLEESVDEGLRITNWLLGVVGLFILLASFFFLPQLTGNIVGSSGNYNILGAAMFLLGVFFLILFFRAKR